MQNQLLVRAIVSGWSLAYQKNSSIFPIPCSPWSFFHAANLIVLLPLRKFIKASCSKSHANNNVKIYEVLDGELTNKNVGSEEMCMETTPIKSSIQSADKHSKLESIPQKKGNLTTILFIFSVLFCHVRIKAYITNLGSDIYTSMYPTAKPKLLFYLVVVDCKVKLNKFFRKPESYNTLETESLDSSL